jgi:hypothetical protein
MINLADERILILERLNKASGPYFEALGALGVVDRLIAQIDAAQKEVQPPVYTSGEDKINIVGHDNENGVG